MTFHNRDMTMMSATQNEKQTSTGSFQAGRAAVSDQTCDNRVRELAARFETFYQTMQSSDIERLGELYHDEVVFIDPIQEVSGLVALQAYYRESFGAVEDFGFAFTDPPIIERERFVSQWQMTFRHKKLNSGDEITLPGISKLTLADSKVIGHRDYYDLGKMVYENVPLLGGIIKKLRKNLA